CHAVSGLAFQRGLCLDKPNTKVIPFLKGNIHYVVYLFFNVSITCSISTQHLGGTFTLQQTSGSFRKSQTSGRNSATFNIPEVNFNNEGLYQCQYQTRVSGREFSSPQSDSVRLSVTGKEELLVPTSFKTSCFLCDGGYQ
uniref:Immunoglobulin-like beta-sandwich domain-containing protein n=1 Tax=Oreochromis niloticus TaxID=8128 RepID=A0A669DI48_ORENI